MNDVDNLGPGNRGRRMENEITKNAGVHASSVGRSGSFEFWAHFIRAEGTGIMIKMDCARGRGVSMRVSCRTGISASTGTPCTAFTTSHVPRIQALFE